MVNNRLKENPGVMVTYLSDFKAHFEGTNPSFNHKATDIDMDPPLSYFTETNVQDTLEAFETVLMAGNDFVSIGDGPTSQGTYTVGVGSLATIEDCFTAALLSSRFANGGIILLKAGTYNFTGTVQLPAGISVFGEIGGTILNRSNDLPFFRIFECSSVPVDSGGVITADGFKVNKFYNLSFFDNKGSPVPILSNVSSCFIIANRGSNIEIERCNFFGKYFNDSYITRMIINYDTGTTSLNNSVLNVRNCSMLGVQKAIQFDIDTSKQNKLSVIGCKLWVNGGHFSASTKERSAISFGGSNVQVSNNIVETKIKNSGTALLDCLCCCDTDTNVKVTMVVSNNQLNCDRNYAIPLNNILRFSSTNPGLNYRTIISNNTSNHGNSSNSWFLTVGDGFSTLGDINGANALQYIYDYFYQQNNLTTSPLYRSEVTIFLKQGTYNINNGYFDTANKNLNFSLIGLNDGGNYPTVKLNQAPSAPGSGGNVSYLGCRLENIIFYSLPNVHWKIIPCDLYSKTTVTGQYEGRTQVKNCFFYNAQIGLEQTSLGAGGILANSTILIENCSFYNQPTTTNATLAQRYMISGTIAHAKLLISNCNTSQGIYGGFLSVIDNSTYAVSDVCIENCYAHGRVDDANIYFISIDNVKQCFIYNNKFKTTTDTKGIYCKASNVGIDSLENMFKFSNNIFSAGTSGATNYTLYGVYAKNFTNVHVDNNYFNKVMFGVYCDLPALSNYNVVVSNNSIILAQNSYGSVVVYNSGATPTAGDVIIENNNIDATSKSTSYTGPSLATMFPKASIFATIYCYVTNTSTTVGCNCVIKNNSIINFTTAAGTVSEQESCIACVKAVTCKIEGNKILCSNTISTRRWYSIYAGASNPETTSACFGHCEISQNDITITSVATENCRAIVCQQYKTLIITNNKISSNNLIKYIMGYAYDPTNTIAEADLPEGIIENNILLNSTLSNIGYGAVLNVDELAGDKTNVLVSSKNNYNQLVKKMIPCFNFVPYGEYRLSTYQQQSGIFVHDNDWIGTTSGLATNIESMKIESSWTLNEGFYYTNLYNNSNHVQLNPPYNQLLIPIDIDTNAKITNIYIPIYFINKSSSSSSVTRKCYVFLGNDVRYSSTKIQIPANSGSVTTSLPWLYFDGATPNPTLSVNITPANPLILSPQRNYYSSVAEGGVCGAQQNLYLLLNLEHSWQVKFAIPYCQVTYRY